MKIRGVPLRYVEDLNEARTQLEAFLSILLQPFFSLFTSQYFNEARQTGLLQRLIEFVVDGE